MQCKFSNMFIWDKFQAMFQTFYLNMPRFSVTLFCFLFMNYYITFFSIAHEILGLCFKAATQRVHNFPMNILSRKSLRTAILFSWIIQHCRTTAYSSSGTYTKVQMSPEIQVKYIRYYQETWPLWCPP